MEIHIVSYPSGYLVYIATGPGSFDNDTYGPYATLAEAEAKERELRDNPPENAYRV